MNEIPDANPDNHTIEQDLVMRQADTSVTPAIEQGTFSKWAYSMKDQNWESEQDEESKMWNTTVQVYVPAINGQKSAVFNAIGYESGIVITLDRQKRRRIVGSIDEPCDITVKEQYTPKNGYIVTVKWQSAYSPFFYAGEIIH